MNFKEAYNTLEIPEGSSKADAKKAFRKLAAKYHPDINKEVDAEANFKKINEAWQVIDSDKPSNHEDEPSSHQYGQWNKYPGVVGLSIEDLIGSMGGHRNQPRRFVNDITLEQTISFKEAVLGCIKEIKYNRDSRCDNCSGSGQYKINNGCSNCNGKGTTVIQNGFSVIRQTCRNCHGKVSYEKCAPCFQKGSTTVEVSSSVNIPPGVIDGNILSLGNRGHYIGDDMMGHEQATRLLLNVHVIPQDGLSIQGDDVIYRMNVSLLEALQGCKKTVPTIDDDKEILIPELIKNNEEVIIPNLGVGRQGNQRIIVNINYPLDSLELINFLKKE